MNITMYKIILRFNSYFALERKFMSKKIKVFYDYTCPFCYKGIGELQDILPDYKSVEVEWSPCEAHPRPEPARVHSDLAAQVGFYIAENGFNIKKYNNLVFEAHFENQQRIDDKELLADLAEQAGAKREDVLELLAANKNAKKVEDSNIEVWDTLGIPAVPSYVCGDTIAASGGGLLVPISKVSELFKLAVNDK